MRRILFLVWFLSLVVSWGCGGCKNGDNGGGEATVTINEVDPAAAYPGVTVTVSFAIEPGEGTSEGGMEWEVGFGDGTRTTGTGIEGEATHVYERAGQYDIEVVALFEGDEVGNAVQPIRVYSPVDLAIQGTAGAPRNARAGEDLQVSFEVVNNTAAEVFTPYEVAAYLSESAAIDVAELDDLVLLGSTTVEPDGEDEVVLESGGSRSSAFNVTLPDTLPGGDYYVITHLDPRGRLADTDVENNIDVSSAIVRVENLAEALPDPCVRDLYVTPDRAFPQLNAFTRGVVLCNNGGQDAFDVTVKTYLSVGDDEFDPDTDRLVDESDVVDVPAMDSEDIGPDQIVLPVGEEIVPTGEDVEVWVIVVAEQSEAEAADSDPENNVLISAAPIVVTDEPVMGPDIVVRDFTVSPDSTFLNGSLNVTAEIANEGTVDVGSFFCGIYLGAGPRVDTNNDPRLTNINVPSLAAGAVNEVDMAVTVPGLYDPGVYYLYMVCDPLNALQEPFRSNNAFIYPNRITITDEADVDLFVESVTVPASADESTMVDVVVRACVQGSNPSGLTKARLFRSAGTQVDFNAPPVLEFDIPNILPGAENCQDIPLQVEATCAQFQDRYIFGVEVDVDNRLPELDETNNRKTASAPLVVAGEFCQCLEDGFEPNDDVLTAVPVMEGVTEAAICTAGNCDFWGVDLGAGDSVVVRTLHSAEKGKLTTALFDTSGSQQLAVDSSADVQEVATFLVPTAGRYVVRVCGATAGDRNLYDLDVNVLPQVSGIDVLPRMVALPFGDSFSVGETIDISFRVYNIGTVAAGAFDAEVYVSPDANLTDDGNNTLLSSIPIASVPAGGIRDVTAPVTIPTTLADGDYHLLIVLDRQDVLTDADATNNRAVSRQFGVRTQCYDPLEPNDSVGQATTVNEGTYSNLQLCAAGDDYYELCLTTGQRFDVTVNFVDANGDIDLELLNDQQAPLDSSANAGTDVEQVALDFVNGDQCYYIHARLVTLDPMLETTYSMTINVEDVDPSLLCDSVFEPNDSFQTASSLAAALDQSFTLDRCPASDTDFYFVNLAAGQNVSFTATKNPTAQAGTLRLQLYHPNQTPGPNKETGPGVPSATIANFIAPTAGTYYLQVTVAGATRNVTYDLTATGLTGVDLSPSNLVIGPGTYAPNDEIRFGATITNLRSTAATAPPYEVFFGESATHDPSSDTSLGTFSAPDVPGNGSVMVNDKVDVPASATAGTKYLHLVVDPGGTTGDSNPANNVTSSAISIAP